MSFFGIEDPTHVGALILLALALFGVGVISLVLRMPARLALARPAERQAHVATSIQKTFWNRGAKKNLNGERLPRNQASPSGPAQNTFAATRHERDCSTGLGLDAQWDRFSNKIADAISASRRASDHHATATTQLDAAEFSVSELFREYPSARVNVNPVTYVEFPALRSRRGAGADHDEARESAIA